MSVPELRGRDLTLRPLSDDDLDALVAIVQAPGVAEWWGTPDPVEREREGLANDGSAFAIEVGGELAGWVGFHEEDEPDYRYASLDISLAPAFQGRGFGPQALRVAIRWLIDERGHHRFTIDPDAGNENAIRAYEAVGFRRVGVMRKGNRRPDGEWHDMLLMDLLAEEFV